MSFRIYRLAKKEAEQGGSEGAFEQTITCPTGQGRGAGIELAGAVQSERKNSRRASFSAGFSFLNFLVTLAASPRWRRMASKRVTESPSCMRRECRRTPQSGAVRILFAVLLYSGRERFLQLVWYIFWP